jgi:hypothetical protein
LKLEGSSVPLLSIFAHVSLSVTHLRQGCGGQVARL